MHTHAHGVSMYPFWFQPSGPAPFPDVTKVIRRLRVPFELELGETAEIVTVDLARAPTLFRQGRASPSLPLLG